MQGLRALSPRGRAGAEDAAAPLLADAPAGAACDAGASAAALQPRQQRGASRSRSPPPLFPRHKLTLAALSWAVVAAVALARGGHGAPSVLPGVACGNAPYWLLLLTAWIALAGLTALVRAMLLRETAASGGGDSDGSGDDDAGGEDAEGGSARRSSRPHPRGGALAWTAATTVVVPAACFAAGVCAVRACAQCLRSVPLFR